jgi:hypothetical protein
LPQSADGLLFVALGTWSDHRAPSLSLVVNVDRWQVAHLVFANGLCEFEPDAVLDAGHRTDRNRADRNGDRPVGLGSASAQRMD